MCGDLKRDGRRSFPFGPWKGASFKEKMGGGRGRDERMGEDSSLQIPPEEFPSDQVEETKEKPDLLEPFRGGGCFLSYVLGQHS